jgi:hypothetical protein
MTPDAPPPAKSDEIEKKENQQGGLRRRRKSEKRLRTKLTAHRWLMDEFNEAAAEASSAGLSFGAFVRAKVRGTPGIRAQRRPSIDTRLISKVDGLHGRYGNNMNQIAFQLNAYGEQGLAADFRGALKEWALIRDCHLQAVGMLPPGRTLLSWKDLMAEGKEYLDANPGAETVCIPAHLLRRIIGNGANNPAA